jgi:hypothetical protein
MLGTYVNEEGGQKVLIANDPFSGQQVTISGVTGQVISAPAGYTNIGFQAESVQAMTVN